MTKHERDANERDLMHLKIKRLQDRNKQLIAFIRKCKFEYIPSDLPDYAYAENLIQSNLEILLKECGSGRFIAWYKEREDIIANGESEEQVKANLFHMYEHVMDYENSLQ